MAFTFYYKSFIASQAEDAATSNDNNSNSNSNNEDSNSNNNDDSYKILYNVINVADNVGLVAAATAATAAAAAATLGRLVHYGLPHYLYPPLPSSRHPTDAVCLPMPRLTIVCNFCALNLKDYFWLILQQNAARLLAKSERQE